MWWTVLLAVLVISLTLRLGIYLGIRRTGADVRWEVPLARLWRKVRSGSGQGPARSG